MEAFYQFAGEHPVLTWFLAWGLWPVAAVLTSPLRYAFRAYNRHLRSKNIRAHGWPTNPLLDADGDIVHPPKDTTP